jgi:phospholipase C
LNIFLSHKTGKKIQEPNISNWRRAVCGDLSSVFRPYNGEKIELPTPVKKDPFIEGIHKAQFKDVPSNFSKLSPENIANANQTGR